MNQQIDTNSSISLHSCVCKTCKLFELGFFCFCIIFSFTDAAVRKKRKRHGGSGRKLFTEGWIEFKDKKIAKAVALSLNNTPFGNTTY